MSAGPVATRWRRATRTSSSSRRAASATSRTTRTTPTAAGLRICQVRRLEKLLSLAPYAGGRRVAIVDAADTLQAEAANAFLKTLEEPPAGSVIILLAERPERLPETVMSRCQRLDFRPVDRDDAA